MPCNSPIAQILIFNSLRSKSSPSVGWQCASVMCRKTSGPGKGRGVEIWAIAPESQQLENATRVDKMSVRMRRACALLISRHISTIRTSMNKIDTSPPILRNMKELDRSLFKKNIPLLTLRVPASSTGALLQSRDLRGYVG